MDDELLRPLVLKYFCDLSSAEIGAIRERGNVDFVLHLAGYYDFSNTEHPAYEQSNVVTTRNMLRHAREVPLLVGVMGDSFGGPTWNAVSADFTVQVKGTCVAVSGPRMLELARTNDLDVETHRDGAGAPAFHAVRVPRPHVLIFDGRFRLE